MEKEIKECIIKKGADVQIDIICSYKQGYSWIDEKVNPALKALGDVERIEVAFKPFLPEGETEWKDEDGATPQYNNVKLIRSIGMICQSVICRNYIRSKIQSWRTLESIRMRLILWHMKGRKSLLIR